MNRETIITMPVRLTDLKPAECLTLRQVREQLQLPGRRKKKAHLDSIRRWANIKRGYRPAGPSGPVVILPTVRLHGEMLTMKDWVAWFLRECQAARDRMGLR